MDCKASIFTAPDLAREAKRRAFVKCNKAQWPMWAQNASSISVGARAIMKSIFVDANTRFGHKKTLIEIDTASMNHPTGEDLLKIVNDQFFRPTSQACAT